MDATVRCPDCGATLEVPRQQLGREVECGVCGEPFQATERQSEPEVILTTPIEDDDRPEYRRRRRSVTAKEVNALGWGIVSLVIGIVGTLLLPISLCCSLGVLGCVVAGLGLLCGLAGIFLNPVHETRGMAQAGIALNLVIFVICSVLFFYVMATK